MAHAVIDCLEVIQVDVENGKGGAAPAHQVERMRHPLTEQSPAGATC